MGKELRVEDGHADMEFWGGRLGAVQSGQPLWIEGAGPPGVVRLSGDPQGAGFLDAVQLQEGELADRSVEAAEDVEDVNMTDDETPQPVPMVAFAALAGMNPAPEQKGSDDCILADLPGGVMAEIDTGRISARQAVRDTADEITSLAVIEVGIDTGRPDVRHAGSVKGEGALDAVDASIWHQGSRQDGVPANLKRDAMLADAEGRLKPLTDPASSGTWEQIEASRIVPDQGLHLRVLVSVPIPEGAGHAAPLAQGFEPAQVARQIVQRLEQSTDQITEIVLTPEELGKVRIAIGQGDSPSVAVYAERSETLDLLRRHVDTLARELRSAGFPATDISFGGGDGGGHQPGSGLLRREMGQLAVTSGTDARPAEQHLRPAAMSGRQLDIRM